MFEIKSNGMIWVVAGVFLLCLCIAVIPVSAADGPPVANFAAVPDSGYAPLNVQFTDTSIADPPVNSWYWDFGDGSTLSGTEYSAPLHVYYNHGSHTDQTYTVSFTAINPVGGNTITKSYTVLAPPAPVANFAAIPPQSGDAPLEVHFSDTSTGTIYIKTWSYRLPPNPNWISFTLVGDAFTFTNAGTYDIMLDVDGPGGSNTKTMGSYITVNTPPPATTITGTVIHDLDHDGVLEAGEPGLEGWTIYLDTDGDNEYDSAEPSKLTDIHGNYSFSVEPGNYVIREILQDSWGQTAPSTPSEFTIVALAQQTYSGNNFGNYHYETGNFNVYTCRVLDSPGTYTLQNDILNSDQNVCIDINSRNVIFDGNDHTISGIFNVAEWPQHEIGDPDVVIDDPLMGLFFAEMYGTPILSLRPPYGIMVHELSTDPLKGSVGVRNIHLAAWETGIFYQDTHFDPVAEGFVQDASIDSSLVGILMDSSQGVVLNTNTLGYGSPDTIGIALKSSHNNRLKNNDITNALAGIGLFFSDDNSLEGNILLDNIMGGIGLYSSLGNTISSNTVTGSRISGISLVNSRGNSLHDNALSGNGQLGAILIESSPNNEFTNNNVNNNDVGILVDSYGEFFSMMGMDLTGYFTQSSSSNTFSHNTINENGGGIGLFASDSNEFHENTISFNQGGAVFIIKSSGTTFISNTLNENGGGIALTNSPGNQFYNNAFNNNNNVVFDTGDTSENSWNTPKTTGTNIIGGSFLGGNYWATPSGTGFSETSATCTDGNGDGICDAAYIITTGNIDNLPLTEPPAIHGTIINQGATVFIGEEGLDVTPAMDAANAQGAAPTTSTTIGWWGANDAQKYVTPPTVSDDLAGREGNFEVKQSVYDGYEGLWYLVDDATTFAKTGTDPVFTVLAPNLDIEIHDDTLTSDVSGNSVTRGTRLTFKIETNMYPAVDHNYRSPLDNPATDGYIDIKVKDENGFEYSELSIDDGERDLLNNYVDEAVWDWSQHGGYWETGVLGDGGSPVYPLGTYTVWAESTLHGMKENYLSGTGVYIGKTVSAERTVTLVEASDGGRDAAIEHGKTYLNNVGSKVEDKELSISVDKVDAGTEVTLLDGSKITSPADYPAWVEYVNLNKNFNYGHAGKLVFYSDDETFEEHDVMMPPTDIALTHEAGNVPDPVGVTSLFPPFDKDPACSPVTTNNYALLIAGGGTRETNYARYYNDIKFMYNTLVTDYQYDPTHIKVLMSDGGTDSTADQIGSYDTANNPVYINSDPNLDGKGINRVTGAATNAAVKTALASFTAGTPSAPIDLFIFTTGHGASNTVPSNTDPGLNQVDLLLWGTGVKINDSEFVNALPANARISMMMQQCNGGGFKNDFIKTSGLTRVLTTAAQGNQASHSNDFSYFWISGVAGHDTASPTNPANADYDGNGQKSMYEAYTYGNTNDPSGPGPNNGKVETPTFSQYGASAGATQFFSACTNPYAIGVTTPSAAWNGGSTATVTWTLTPTTGLPTGTNVKIELMKGAEPGWPQTTIYPTKSAALKTAGPWTVPLKLNGGLGTDYWIKISTINLIPQVIGRSNTFEIKGVTKSGTADLTIQSTPSSLPIILNDWTGFPAKDINGVAFPVYTTPHTFTLPGGDYYVSLSKSCYYNVNNAKVSLLAGNSQTKPYTLLAMKAGTCDNSDSGSIHITSDPQEGFHVFIDGTEMNYDTPVFQDIGAGDHQVRLELSGYISQTQTVPVVAGLMTEANFVLTKLNDVNAQVLIVPQPLNIGRTGYFLAFVKLPTGSKAADVDAGSVTCEGAKALKLVRIKLFPQIFVGVFQRQDLAQYVLPNDRVTLHVNGEIKKSGGNVLFMGSNTIKVTNTKTTTKEDVDNVMTMTDTQLFTKFNKF